MKKYVFVVLALLFVVSCSNQQPREAVKMNEQGEKTIDIEYYNSGADEHINEYCTLSQAIDYFKLLSQLDESFLIVSLNKSQVLQFVWEENGQYLAEITNDGEDRIFQQRYATFDECIDMITVAYTGDIHKYEGFVPVPIMEKTLDEVLSENAASGK